MHYPLIQFVLRRLLRLARTQRLRLRSAFLLGVFLCTTPVAFLSCGGAELLEGTAHAQLGPTKDWPSIGTTLSLPVLSLPASEGEPLAFRIYGIRRSETLPFLPKVTVSRGGGLFSNSPYTIDLLFSDTRVTSQVILGAMISPSYGPPEDPSRTLPAYDSQLDSQYQNAAWQLVKYRLWNFKHGPEKFRSYHKDIRTYQRLLYNGLVSLAKKRGTLPLSREMDIVCEALPCETASSPTPPTDPDPADEEGLPAAPGATRVLPLWLPLPDDVQPIGPLGGITLPPDFPVPQDTADIDACIKSRPFLQSDPAAVQAVRSTMLPLDAAGRADFCKTLPEKATATTILEYGNLYYQRSKILYKALAQGLGISESEAAQQKGYEALMRHLMPSADTLKKLGTLGRGVTATGLIMLGSYNRLAMAVGHPVATLTSLVKPQSEDEELATRARWLAVKKDPNSSFLQRGVAFLDAKQSYVASANNHLLLGLPLMGFFNPFYAGALAGTGLARVFLPIISAIIKIGLSIHQAAVTEDPDRFEQAVHTGSAALFEIQMAVIVAVVTHTAGALKIKPRIAAYLRGLKESIKTNPRNIVQAVSKASARFAADAKAFQQRMLQNASAFSPGALPASQAEFARGVLEGKYKQFIPELTAEQRAVFERVTKGEASLAEQQGMKLLMEQLQEMQPAVELASGDLYEKEMAKTKEWTEKIGQAGSEEEALRVLGEAEKALGDVGAFDTAVEVMKESVERQAEAGLKRIGREWPQARALGKCWRGCKGVRAVPSAERGRRARGEIARKLKGAEKARFEELAGKVERHRRVSGLELWMEMNRGLPANEIAGNLGQLEEALRLARERPGARVALTLGREPVVWEGAGPPPVPESLRRYAQQPQQLLGTGTDGPVDLRARVVPGGGPEKPGTTVASAGGGKPAGPTEVGTVRPAGGPAAVAEAPARAAEPPRERPQPPAAVESVAETQRPVPMLPNGEVGIVVDVPPSTKPNVNPATTALFEQRCERIEQKRLGPEFDYQRRMVGPNEIVAKGGGTQVEADGINIQEGYLQDAKFVKNPESSLYLGTLNVPGKVLSSMMKGIDDLFFRYGEVIRDPNIPVNGLEVITNDRRAFPFFERLMKKYNVPGRVVERK